MKERLVERRVLGPGMSVSAQGLGCMGMSEFDGAGDDAESPATIRGAPDAGVNLLDTADAYGPLTNDELVGRAFAGRRDEVVLATKVGNQRASDGSFAGVNGRPEYVHQACEASLARLGVETIDLYDQHRVDRATPIEETWRAVRARGRRQGPPPGHLGGLVGHHRAGSRGAPGDRATERVLVVDPRS